MTPPQPMWGLHRTAVAGAKNGENGQTGPQKQKGRSSLPRRRASSSRRALRTLAAASTGSVATASTCSACPCAAGSGAHPAVGPAGIDHLVGDRGRRRATAQTGQGLARALRQGAQYKGGEFRAAIKALGPAVECIWAGTPPPAEQPHRVVRQHAEARLRPAVRL